MCPLTGVKCVLIMAGVNQSGRLVTRHNILDLNIV